MQLIIIMLFGLCQSALSETFDDSEVRHVGYPDWFVKNPFYDLSEDLGNAVSQNKIGLMVLFTTEGCSYCDIFIKKSLGDAELAAKTQAGFDTVGLEIFDDAEMISPAGVAMPIKEFAKSEGVEFSPTLLFYDGDGKRILRLTGYLSPVRYKAVLDYLQKGHYQKSSLRQYFKDQAAPSASSRYEELKNDPLFSQPPYALDRTRFSSGQPLLIIFEEPGCEACFDFHNEVLSQPEVRKLLRHFEVVRLNIDDMKTPILAPDGSKTTPSDWYEKTDFTRVPGFLFINEKGRQVLETDTLVLRQRLMNSLYYVIERAYEKDWTYQRFARSKAIERHQGK